ncbi:hypothetical protein L1987_23564 [Smallanthus sonchifolius]|uniref:Uncharacterized protein n=1 Tax=Smallanthus sonchifolius TaxID=185202 RepID=A0ACB9IIK1_9ASTR|nr:hypothetical protein L1987_23564 [Smallanthus sonchifolius]
MNPISTPNYNKDPFAILHNGSPEYQPQSHDSSNQWMNAGSYFSNWRTDGQQLQGNNEVESSHAQHNTYSEEDPSEDSYHYEPVSENPDDYPFNNPVSNSSDYQSHNSGSPVLYDPYMFLEPPYDGPFKEYFHAPPKYQNSYNDIMVGLREPPPKYGYEHIMPSSHIECLECSLRQTDEITWEKIIDKARTKFYGKQTVPVLASHINENALGSERERILLKRVTELEREKAEVEARNAFMSKNTGPSQNTRGRKKQAVVENAAENTHSRADLQKLIAEGIKDSPPMIFDELEKRQAGKLSVQHSIPKSVHSQPLTQHTRTISQSKPVTLKPEGSTTHKTKKTEREEYYHNSSEDEGMGNNYGHVEKKRKVVGCTYKMFQDCKPYNFSGREGGIATLRWIEKTESVLAINKCVEEDKVLYASNLFKDQALEWWNNIIAAKGREAAYTMGWSAFKSRIEKKYVPHNEREQIEGKFLSLKMIGTNHQEYSTKLLEYARIVPHIATPESNLIKRYIWGLIGEICDMVKVVNCENLDDAMDLGASLTSSLIRNQEEGKKKKEAYGQGPSGSTKSTFTPRNKVLLFLNFQSARRGT